MRSTAEGRDIEIELSETRVDIVNMTIDKQQSGRDQATGPPERETLQEWKCHCGHHTGSGRDMDSAIIVAIQYEQQEEPTVLLKPSV
jgi:hypothetical protein